MRLKLLWLVLFLSPLFLHAQKREPVNVIFDSDMGPDYDDVGAITLLHAFADSGRANILATIASTKYEGVAAVFSVLNTYFNRPDVPIAVPKGDAIEEKDFQHWTDTLRANYEHSINSNDEVADAVDLYRKLLASQPDTSVTIITVGFLTNIANLLKSEADDYSPLNGEQLVKKKVKKMVSMAGKFPSGSEFNVAEDAEASRYAFSHWNRPLIFSGFEIGEKILAGLPLINNEEIQGSPVKDVFRISINMRDEDKNGRKSWDQTAVLVAIAGHEPYYTLKAGHIAVDAKGHNTWSTKNKGQYYLVSKTSPSVVEKVINEMMMHQPVNNTRQQ